MVQEGGAAPATAANSTKDQERSAECSDRNTRFAAAPVAKSTAIAAAVAGALIAMLNSSAHSTQNTAAAHPTTCAAPRFATTLPRICSLQIRGPQTQNQTLQSNPYTDPGP